VCLLDDESTRSGSARSRRMAMGCAAWLGRRPVGRTGRPGSGGAGGGILPEAMELQPVSPPAVTTVMAATIRHLLTPAIDAPLMTAALCPPTHRMRIAQRFGG
jgi:hypothetical protein